jgi:hypothetical protein
VYGALKEPTDMQQRRKLRRKRREELIIPTSRGCKPYARNGTSTPNLREADEDDLGAAARILANRP